MASARASAKLATLLWPLWRAQVLHQNLATGVSRQHFEEIERFWRFEAGNPTACKRSYLVLRHRGKRKNDRLDRLPLARTGDAHNSAVGDGRVLVQGIFNPGRVDVFIP